MTPRAVLDTNVVVSALLKLDGLESQVLRLGLQGKVKLFASPAILAEYALVLARPHLKLNSQEIHTTLQQLQEASVLVHPRYTLTACPHEEDNRFVECAEAAEAHFLVTGNKRHFPATWKSTRVMNAREFLEYFAAQQN